MTDIGFKESMLLPVNIGGAVLSLFALFKASQGERAPAVLPVVILCIVLTLWIISTTKIVRIKQAVAAGALVLTNSIVIAVLALNGFGSR